MWQLGAISQPPHDRDRAVEKSYVSGAWPRRNSNSRRPQATAGDRRRPQATAAGDDRRRSQATAGDRRRPQATAAGRRPRAAGHKRPQAASKREHSKKKTRTIPPYPGDLKFIGIFLRTSERRRRAEASGDRAKAAHSAQRRANDRGTMATSHFTPPGATAPTQSNDAARRVR